MSRCARIRGLLSAYVDEKTTEQERLQVGLHLTRCPECRRRLEQLRRFRLSLLASPRVPVPSGFSAGWRAGLRQEQPTAKTRPGTIWGRRATVLAPLAACVLLFATGLAIFLPQATVRKKAVPDERPAVLAQSPPASSRVVTEEAPAALKEPVAPPSVMADRGTVPAAPEPIADKSSPARTEEAPALPAQGSPGSGASGGVDRASAALHGLKAVAPTGILPETRNSGEAAAPAPGKAADNQSSQLTGSWRVWLTAIGPHPSAIVRVLTDRGFLHGGSASASFEAPFLLNQGLSYGEAQEMAQSLQDAGARTVVELIPF